MRQVLYSYGMHVLPDSLVKQGLPVKGVSLNNAAGGKPAGLFLLAVIVSVSHWMIPEKAPLLFYASIVEVGTFANRDFYSSRISTK